MNKICFYLIVMGSAYSVSCTDGPDESVQPAREFTPTDVFIKTKEHISIDQVFGFINGFDHDVESVASKVYQSDLPSDSLQYVLDYLTAKPYTHSELWPLASGYLHYETKQITLFPRLFLMKNKDYQEDWLATMHFLKLTERTGPETSGYIIHFHVPEGQEKEWESKFKEYDFVEWAELNYLVNITF